jgi:energy-coupling factor transporter ATP-binding protein EcfA2
MGKIVENEYTGTEALTADQIRQALSGDYEGFKYFFENCLLIQDRDTRQYIHPKMNLGQQMIAKAIFKNVDKKTRKNEHREIVVIGPRQFGKSTLFTAIGDYLPAYVPGMENLNTVHTLQTGTTAGKYFKQKIAPIVANVHPSIFPTIERDTLGTSTLLKFKDIKGIPRGGYYEVVSAGSNSVRSGTVSVWLCDEPSEYRNPEMVEDAISGAISSYAWSFTAYIGTFSDRLSNYFLNKIKLAIDNPDEVELIFIPWFLVYGREGDGLGFTEEQMTEYDREVIIPEMRKWGIPQSEWFDKLGWYHTRALRTSKMRYEFPSSVDDIITMTSDRLVFDGQSIDKQEANVLVGKKYRIVTDNATGKVEAQETDISPFTIFKGPIYGHQYRIAIDPITAQSTDTDNFVMQVMDTTNHEQVAVFRDRGLQDEDYADWAVSIGTIYNKAQLCPETNVANGFIVAVNSRRYYRWWYQNKKNQADRIPGIRTTASSKEYMVDCLRVMLDRENIIIHDKYTIDELRNFVRHVKKRSDGTPYIRFAARSGHHDDDIASLWIYAGSLDMRQIEGRKKTRFAII